MKTFLDTRSGMCGISTLLRTRSSTGKANNSVWLCPHLVLAIISLVTVCIIAHPVFAGKLDLIPSPTAGKNSSWPFISGDGRFVAFDSFAANTTTGKPTDQIFVYDRQTAKSEVVSVANDGTLGDRYSNCREISQSGQIVLFTSNSSNLRTSVSNSITSGVTGQNYIRDRQTHKTKLVAVDSDGKPVLGLNSIRLSPNGRFIIFTARDDVAGVPSNEQERAYVQDLQAGKTERIPKGWQPLYGYDFPSISSDGRYAAFLCGGQICVYDRQTNKGATVSRTVGAQIQYPLISADGRFVVFICYERDTDNHIHINAYVSNWASGKTELVSVSSDGKAMPCIESPPCISADGRYVAFVTSTGQHFSRGGGPQVYVRDRKTKTTRLVSEASNGTPGNGDSDHPTISDDGRYIAFFSTANNLLPEKTPNHISRIYVRDMWAK